MTADEKLERDKQRFLTHYRVLCAQFNMMVVMDQDDDEDEEEGYFAFSVAEYSLDPDAFKQSIIEMEVRDAVRLLPLAESDEVH